MKLVAPWRVPTRVSTAFWPACVVSRYWRWGESPHPMNSCSTLPNSIGDANEVHTFGVGKEPGETHFHAA